MQRLLVLILMMVFALSVLEFIATEVSAKAKPVKKPVVSDQLLVKKAVLAYDDVRLKQKTPTSLNSVKFGPIKIASGWATTTYNMLDRNGKETLTCDPPTYILKKVKSKWQVKMVSEKVAIDVDQCKKIGLPFAIAKKLGVVQWWD